MGWFFCPGIWYQLTGGLPSSWYRLYYKSGLTNFFYGLFYSPGIEITQQWNKYKDFKDSLITIVLKYKLGMGITPSCNDSISVKLTPDLVDQRERFQQSYVRLIFATYNLRIAAISTSLRLALLRADNMCCFKVLFPEIWNVCSVRLVRKIRLLSFIYLVHSTCLLHFSSSGYIQYLSIECSFCAYERCSGVKIRLND